MFQTGQRWSSDKYLCVLDRFEWFIHPRDNESLQFPRSHWLLNNKNCKKKNIIYIYIHMYIYVDDIFFFYNFCCSAASARSISAIFQRLGENMLPTGGQ